MTEQQTFSIPIVRWDDFQAKWTRLNRRAAKLGCQPCTFTVVEERDEERTMAYGDNVRSVKVPVRVIAVSGEAPRLADWRLVARVEQLSDEVTLVHSVPGLDRSVDPRFRSLGGHVCEHCATPSSTGCVRRSSPVSRRMGWRSAGAALTTTGKREEEHHQ